MKDSQEISTERPLKPLMKTTEEVRNFDPKPTLEYYKTRYVEEAETYSKNCQLRTMSTLEARYMQCKACKQIKHADGFVSMKLNQVIPTLKSLKKDMKPVSLVEQ